MEALKAMAFWKGTRGRDGFAGLFRPAF